MVAGSVAPRVRVSRALPARRNPPVSCSLVTGCGAPTAPPQVSSGWGPEIVDFFGGGGQEVGFQRQTGPSGNDPLDLTPSVEVVSPVFRDLTLREAKAPWEPQNQPNRVAPGRLHRFASGSMPGMGLEVYFRPFLAHRQGFRSRASTWTVYTSRCMHIVLAQRPCCHSLCWASLARENP